MPDMPRKSGGLSTIKKSQRQPTTPAATEEYEDWVDAYKKSHGGRAPSDSLIMLGIRVVVGFLFLWIPYLLVARSPRRWWLYTGLLAVPFLFLSLLRWPFY